MSGQHLDLPAAAWLAGWLQDNYKTDEVKEVFPERAKVKGGGVVHGHSKYIWVNADRHLISECLLVENSRYIVLSYIQYC